MAFSSTTYRNSYAQQNQQINASKLRRLKNMPTPFKFFFPFVAILAVAGLVFGIFQATGNETVAENCVVTDKSITALPDNGGSDMRIYTANCGTLKVGDNLFKGIFNSADIYGSIMEGETYTFKTTGIRFGLGSQFPTIYEISN